MAANRKAEQHSGSEWKTKKGTAAPLGIARILLLQLPPQMKWKGRVSCFMAVSTTRGAAC